MEAVADLEQLYNQDPFDDATFEQVRHIVGQSSRQRGRLTLLLEALQERATDDASSRSTLALRLGLGWCLLRQHRSAPDGIRSSAIWRRCRRCSRQTDWTRPRRPRDRSVAMQSATLGSMWLKGSYWNGRACGTRRLTGSRRLWRWTKNLPPYSSG